MLSYNAIVNYSVHTVRYRTSDKSPLYLNCLMCKVIIYVTRATATLCLLVRGKRLRERSISQRFPPPAYLHPQTDVGRLGTKLLKLVIFAIKVGLLSRALFALEVIRRQGRSIAATSKATRSKPRVGKSLRGSKELRRRNQWT